MERQRSYNGRRRRNEDENPKITSQYTLQRSSSLPPLARAPPPPNELKLAAIAVDLNVRLRSADMPLAMQERAIRRARALLDAKKPDNAKRSTPNPTRLAMCLKKEFDALYGPAWHCVVGKSFGSFVTHGGGGFLYFSVDKFCFLLFKTEVRPLLKPPSLLRLKTSN
ncbi:Cell number regulator 6 isoform 1 [Hibiscus syriacus]|uniref:Dynein light chain n=1 Tax=Hibiscus syriacus TaxID=106335 RepID=A0A6A2Z8V6_HIBSY|nr:uncharacterized protein LOC120149257 [Hibiscus syriacus]KAE8688137.1 Cell number regulator 6 isoform 1 [Hibiscus syriacus]